MNVRSYSQQPVDGKVDGTLEVEKVDETPECG